MDDLETIVEATPRDLGGFTVGRVLPSLQKRRVGPFVFLDHMGPVTMPPGRGMDVRPHPHIGLATVTYLFEGEIMHRDTLGNAQAIRPGAVNWMTAGRGIAHSERTPPDVRATGCTMHGLQMWIGLPTAHEATEPTFFHHPSEALPTWSDGGVTCKLLVGEAFGRRSPVQVFSPTFYVDAQMPAGSSLTLPSFAERAAYVVRGQLTCAGHAIDERHAAVFARDAQATITAEVDSRVALFGGEALDGARHLWWNFVSSDPARIEDAKRRWRDGGFGLVPGDEDERIPLPEA